MEDISYKLRVTTVRAEALVSELVTAGLFEWRDGICYSHNFNGRNFRSDVSTERVKRYRNASGTDTGNVPRNVPPDVPETGRQRTEKEIIPPIVPLLEFGEFKRAKMTAEQYAKLKAELNGNLDDYIARFDRWVNDAPDAKKDGVKRKDRHAYESIGSWFSRDVKEGKLRRTAFALPTKVAL